MSRELTIKLPQIEIVQEVTTDYLYHLDNIKNKKELFRFKCKRFITKNKKRIKNFIYVNCIIDLCEIDRLIMLKPFVEKNKYKDFVNALMRG